MAKEKSSKNGSDRAVRPAMNGAACGCIPGAGAAASQTRDGVGPTTLFARVSKGQPPPSIAPGAKPGEWYIAWLDYEAGYLEPYAARVQCQ